MMKDAGNEVFGYVSTKRLIQGEWSLLKLSDIKKSITAWSRSFDLTGILLDQVTDKYELRDNSVWGNHVQLYQFMFEFIKETNPSLKIMINPGNPFPIQFFLPSQCHHGKQCTADSAVIFDDTADRWDPDALANSLEDLRSIADGKRGFGALIHSTSVDSLCQTVNQARQAGLEYLYVTDKTEANQYQGLPTYWQQLLDLVR